VAVEVARGDEVLQRYGNGLVDAAGFGWAKQGGSEASVGLGTMSSLP
jgi:hypothetical protein